MNVIIQIQGREAIPVRALSLEHYTFWNDYHTLKSVNRQGAITRANSDANARANQNSIDSANRSIRNKSYECKPNYSGTALNCN
jgi:hypothetical protein